MLQGDYVLAWGCYNRGQKSWNHGFLELEPWSDGAARATTRRLDVTTVDCRSWNRAPVELRGDAPALLVCCNANRLDAGTSAWICCKREDACDHLRLWRRPQWRCWVLPNDCVFLLEPVLLAGEHGEIDLCCNGASGDTTGDMRKVTTGGEERGCRRWPTNAGHRGRARVAASVHPRWGVSCWLTRGREKHEYEALRRRGRAGRGGPKSNGCNWINPTHARRLAKFGPVDRRVALVNNQSLTN